MMRLNHVVMAILVIAIFTVGVFASQALGFWQTSKPSGVAMVTLPDGSQKADPAAIRGSHSWNELSELYGIPVADFKRAFSLSDADLPLKINVLEARFADPVLAEQTRSAGIEGEIGTDAVRWYVALLTGVPMEAKDGTGMPAAALALLHERGVASQTIVEPAQISNAPAASVVPAVKASTPAVASPKPATFAPPASSAPAASHAPASEPKSTGFGTGTGSGSTGGTVGGKTTFGQLYAMGADKVKVQSVLGGIGDDSMTIRDWLSANGKEFSTYKESLQALLTQ